MDDRKKKYIYIGVLLVIAVLMCNTNNDPTPFLQRIIPSIEKGGSVLYWQNIIASIVVYICTDGLWRSLDWRFIKKVDRFLHPFIRQIIVLVLFAQLGYLGGESCIRFYKSFQEDIDAIYLQREESSMRLKGCKYENEDGENMVSYMAEGGITLENCSRNSVGPFKVQVIAESDFDDDLSAEGVMLCELPDTYMLSPKEVKRISAQNQDQGIEGVRQIGVSSNSRVKLVLISENETCSFENRYR